jgi:hypothetical protein
METREFRRATDPTKEEECMLEVDTADDRSAKVDDDKEVKADTLVSFVCQSSTAAGSAVARN